MKIDKDIYIDVDGTLTRESLVDDGIGEFDQVRDNAVEFIEFLVSNFKNVYWLSSNPRFCNEYLIKCGRKDLNDRVKYLYFKKSKCEAIDYSRAFYYFDDEIEYDYFNQFGLLKNETPSWKKEPYKSMYNPSIHNMYYIPSNAPLDFLISVMEDIKKRENIR